MVRIAAISASVATVALLGATAYVALTGGSDDAFAQCRGGAVSGGAGSIGGPFELINEDGALVTDQDVFTKPTILYFGYTFCPDVCPLDNMRNADAQRLLEEQGYDVQSAFITVDPARDTVEVVKDFTDLFHDNMIGLTGSEEQVRTASQAYKTYYRRHDDEDPEYYLVDHSTFTYLVMPETGFADFFRREDTPEGMAERVACFVDAAQ